MNNIELLLLQKWHCVILDWYHPLLDKMGITDMLCNYFKCPLVSPVEYECFGWTVSVVTLCIYHKFCLHDSRAPQHVSPLFCWCFITIIVSYFIGLSLSSLDIDCTCLFSLFIFFLLYISILLCPSHPYLPSSARLYQGLGKLSVPWVHLSLRYLYMHDYSL